MLFLTKCANIDQQLVITAILIVAQNLFVLNALDVKGHSLIF
jgi:hypothetical protein